MILKGVVKFGKPFAFSYPINIFTCVCPGGNIDVLRRNTILYNLGTSTVRMVPRPSDA